MNNAELTKTINSDELSFYGRVNLLLNSLNMVKAQLTYDETILIEYESLLSILWEEVRPKANKQVRSSVDELFSGISKIGAVVVKSNSSIKWTSRYPEKLNLLKNIEREIRDLTEEIGLLPKNQNIKFGVF